LITAAEIEILRRPHLGEAAVAAAPLRIARGNRNKVPKALEGLDAEPGANPPAASASGEWAVAFVRLLGDEPLRRRLDATGRHFVERCQDRESYLEPFACLLGLPGSASLPAGAGMGSSWGVHEFRR
jgi:hypothetical protein